MPNRESNKRAVVIPALVALIVSGVLLVSSGGTTTPAANNVLTSHTPSNVVPKRPIYVGYEQSSIVAMPAENRSVANSVRVIRNAKRHRKNRPVTHQTFVVDSSFDDPSVG